MKGLLYQAADGTEHIHPHRISPKEIEVSIPEAVIEESTLHGNQRDSKSQQFPSASRISPKRK
jgi:hypothetical protein